uniref:Uncharacterized protein n=1 Tax=Parascaris equorum TaxID=6256 RepID=A0A914RCX3_PAREQ
MFPGGIGRDAASMEQMKKEAALKAKADLTAFILFGFAIEVEAIGTAIDIPESLYDKMSESVSGFPFLQKPL